MTTLNGGLTFMQPTADRYTPNQALQRTAATALVCQGVKFTWLPRPLSLGVRRLGFSLR